MVVRVPTTDESKAVGHEVRVKGRCWARQVYARVADAEDEPRANDRGAQVDYFAGPGDSQRKSASREVSKVTQENSVKRILVGRLLEEEEAEAPLNSLRKARLRATLRLSQARARSSLVRRSVSCIFTPPVASETARLDGALRCRGAVGRRECGATHEGRLESRWRGRGKGRACAPRRICAQVTPEFCICLFVLFKCLTLN